MKFTFLRRKIQMIIYKMYFVYSPQSTKQTDRCRRAKKYCVTNLLDAENDDMVCIMIIERSGGNYSKFMEKII